jgi:hypothetical protein
MRSPESSAVDKAIARLHERNVFRKGEREFQLRSLLPESSWRPLRAAWWRKKEAYVIGEDPSGNIFLRVCDGTVRFWDQHTQEDQLLAPSVRAFLSSLLPSPPRKPST